MVQVSVIVVPPAPTLPPELPLALPAPVVDPLPQHSPVTVGAQEKPSPQSASALHGNAHLNVQVETVWLVQMGLLGHFVLGGQGGVSPSEQVVWVWAWQTMPAPQSLSAVQGPG